MIPRPGGCDTETEPARNRQWANVACYGTRLPTATIPRAKWPRLSNDCSFCADAPGASNRHFAATLIVSARTWHHHFHSAWRTLGVTSRDEPARVLRWQPPGRRNEQPLLKRTRVAPTYN